MRVSRPPRAVVVWSQGLHTRPSRPADDRHPARRLLARVVAEFIGSDPRGIRVVSRCSFCGSTEHGRPHVELPPGQPPVWVSLARAGSAVAVACGTAPIGVDLERTDDTRLDDLDAVVVAPGEQEPATTTERARLWVRKEAVLKALGVGLTWDPRRVRVAPCGDVWLDGRLRADAHLSDLDGPVGYALALCVLSAAAPAIVFHDGHTSLLTSETRGEVR